MYKKSKNKTGNQKVKNATAITIDGINFRSKLEAYTYDHLTKAGLTFEYESKKFTLLEKFEYPADSFESYKSKKVKYFGLIKNKVRGITYLPDFVSEEDNWIIEVKGYANDAFPLKWKMFKNLLRDTPYTLYKPTSQKQVREVVELILKRKNHEKVDDIELDTDVI